MSKKKDIAILLAELLTFYNKDNDKFTQNINLAIKILDINNDDSNNNICIKKKILVSDTIWDDLSIFSINGFFHKTQKTHTFFGFITQANSLTEPIIPDSKLYKFQNIIKKLASENINYGKSKKLLDNIRNKQDDLLWFWKERSPEENKLYDNVFFCHSYLTSLNKNRLSLFIYYIYRTLIQPTYVVISPLLCFIIPYIVLRFKLGLNFSVKLYLNILSKVVPASFGIMKRGETSHKKMVWVYLSAIVSALLYIQTVYSQLSQVFNLISTSNNIKNKIIRFLETLKEIKRLNDIIGLYPNLPEIPNILTDINSYDPTPTYLWRYWLLKNGHLEQFKKWMVYLGELDMTLSLVSYIRELRRRNLPYCFTKFSETSKSHMKAIEIWHPCLDLDNKIITNHFQLGNGFKRNMLITGPNAGGKSTLVKSVCLNCLLSQTWGISTSKYFFYSPYSLIYTHFRLHDLTGEKSLFQEEVNRCRYLLENRQSGNFLAIFDELFCSTSVLEGISCAYSLIEMIGAYSNGTTILTTHYPILTNLSQNLNCSFINTQMQCYSKDKLIFSYKLVKGVSTSHVALKLLNTCPQTKTLILNATKLQDQLLRDRRASLYF